MHPIAAKIARGAAAHIEAEAGREDIVPHVEAILHGPAGGERRSAESVVTPEIVAAATSVAGVVVMMAALAWQVYRDTKKTTGKPPAKDALTRQVRLKAAETLDLPEGKYTREIEIVVEETVNGDY